jgi:hypothetical protein
MVHLKAAVLYIAEPIRMAELSGFRASDSLFLALHLTRIPVIPVVLLFMRHNLRRMMFRSASHKAPLLMALPQLGLVTLMGLLLIPLLVLITLTSPRIRFLIMILLFISKPDGEVLLNSALSNRIKEDTVLDFCTHSARLQNFGALPYVRMSVITVGAAIQRYTGHFS